MGVDTGVPNQGSSVHMMPVTEGPAKNGYT